MIIFSKSIVYCFRVSCNRQLCLLFDCLVKRILVSKAKERIEILTNLPFILVWWISPTTQRSVRWSLSELRHITGTDSIKLTLLVKICQHLTIRVWEQSQSVSKEIILIKIANRKMIASLLTFLGTSARSDFTFGGS